MLLVPEDLAKFVDNLARSKSLPGIPITRQDAIRSVLTKLQAELEASFTPATSPAKPRNTRQGRATQRH